jgi:phosphoglycerate kinase
MVNLPRIEDADLKDKIVLVRVDHNVVKSGVIDDPDRITKSKPTIDYILKHGGKPILMTHIGRPRDQSGIITITDHETITPVADYLEEHWNLKVAVPEADTKNASEKGLQGINESIRTAVENLKAGNVDIYRRTCLVSRRFC